MTVEAGRPGGWAGRLMERVAHLVTYPALLRTVGRDLNRGFVRDLLTLKQELHLIPATIIDAGASTGGWSRAALFVFPSVRVFAFEPVPESFHTLSACARREPRLVALPYALGSADGRTTLHRNDFPDASSVLPAAPLLARLYPQAGKAEDLPVDQRRVDSVLEERPPLPVLLKMDVQGAEREVLAGCGALLRQISAVLLELNFAPLYGRQAEYHDLCNDLHREGFTQFLQLHPVLAPSGEIISCDMLFLRSRERPGVERDTAA